MDIKNFNNGELQSFIDYKILQKEVQCKVGVLSSQEIRILLCELKNEIAKLKGERERNLSIHYTIIIFFLSIMLSEIVSEIIQLLNLNLDGNLISIIGSCIMWVVVTIYLYVHTKNLVNERNKKIYFLETVYEIIEENIKNDLKNKQVLISDTY